MCTYLAEHTDEQKVRSSLLKLTGGVKQAYGGMTETDDDTISKKEEATISTLILLTATSASETLLGSSSYPWPGGLSTIVLMRGWMSVLKY